jgi:hypothetical protein
MKCDAMGHFGARCVPDTYMLLVLDLFVLDRAHTSHMVAHAHNMGSDMMLGREPPGCNTYVLCCMIGGRRHIARGAGRKEGGGIDGCCVPATTCARGQNFPGEGGTRRAGESRHHQPVLREVPCWFF